MKAGIYKSTDGTGRYIYVRKDRSIAFDTHWNLDAAGNRGNVSTFDKEQFVIDDLYGGEYRRVSDVPNGCTNPVTVVRTFINTDLLPTEKRLAALQGHVVNDNGALAGPSPLIAESDAAEDTDFSLPDSNDAVAPPKMSKQLVYGYGPGFLSQRAAFTESTLLKDADALNMLESAGILRHVAHDEWEVVNAELYAAYCEAGGNMLFKPVPYPSGGEVVKQDYFAPTPLILPRGHFVSADSVEEHLQKAGEIHRSMIVNPEVIVTEKRDHPSAFEARNRQTEFYASLVAGAREFRPGRGRLSAAMVFALPYGDPGPSKSEAMKRLGYRLCHGKSARKHRKAGHYVIPSGDGAFWWADPRKA